MNPFGDSNNLGPSLLVFTIIIKIGLKPGEKYAFEKIYIFKERFSRRSAIGENDAR